MVDIKKQLLTSFLLFSLILWLSAQPNGKISVISDKDIKVSFTSNGISSISSPSDTFNANIVRGFWGNPVVKYRIGSGDWLDIYRGETELKTENPQTITCTDYIKGVPLKMAQTFTVKDGGIDWKIEIETMMGFPVTIGDLAIPFPWTQPEGEEPDYIFEKTFTKHHFISGNGSFLYFTKPSGIPPFMVVTVKPGTGFEYFDDKNGVYKAYIHSGLSGNNVKEGTWRQVHTYLNLSPAGKPGSKVTYGLRLEWADSWDEMRDIICRNGLFDIRVVPGMSLPQDLTAKFSLHTINKIDSITSEFPSATELKYLGEVKPSFHMYEVRFRKPGENLLTIHYAENRHTFLEFFSTEPVETLIKKRSSFIVNRQQHIVPGKWYNGLYSVYDMKNSILRGPDNTDGYDFWWGYVLACDDPGLCKAPFVAAKNVFFPDDKEIASVEYYLKNFVWGGLQRTDQETPYPYGIYGVPNWMVARDSLLRAGVDSRNLDKIHIWRSYDYPHMIMLYYHMYQIAEMYPAKVHYLDAAGYLERAWQTAKAYFIYPYEILPWYDTYKWGCYNELVIENLIIDLNNNGRKYEAEWLRKEYEKKVKYFIYDDKYPYRSEYSIDRTAFESSYAFARYGAINDMQPDSNLWYDKNLKKWYSHPVIRKQDALKFMQEQNSAGLAVRGWLEAQYYMLGSDFTNNSDDHALSYMAKMGGWAILDYGLRFAEKPYDWLQLGYASYLSSWALMNTGNEESNYGFWAPGKENDGAMGWAFMSSKFARAWNRKDYPRGAWYYDGEADLGNGAAIRISFHNPD